MRALTKSDLSELKTLFEIFEEAEHPKNSSTKGCVKVAKIRLYLANLHNELEKSVKAEANKMELESITPIPQPKKRKKRVKKEPKSD